MKHSIFIGVPSNVFEVNGCCSARYAGLLTARCITGYIRYLENLALGLRYSPPGTKSSRGITLRPPQVTWRICILPDKYCRDHSGRCWLLTSRGCNQSRTRIGQSMNLQFWDNATKALSIAIFQRRRNLTVLFLSQKRNSTRYVRDLRCLDSMSAVASFCGEVEDCGVLTSLVADFGVTGATVSKPISKQATSG